MPKRSTTPEKIPPGFNLRHTLREHNDVILGIAWSPEGNILASGAEDHTIRIWDVESGKLKNIIEGHTGRVKGVLFSPDGHLLVLQSYDQTALGVVLFDPTHPENPFGGVAYWEKASRFRYGH